MIRAAVIGAAGYTGGEVLRLLIQHPHVDAASIVAVSSSHAGKPLTAAHPDLWGYTRLTFADSLVGTVNVDVVFLCMGHGKSSEWMATHDVSENVKVIDLSSDYRASKSGNPFQYGLPEKHREAIVRSSRIANPGCLATATELALLPLAEKGLDGYDVVVHAVTGSTGAGQQPIDTTHYSWRDSNVSTYKAFEHQHEAEILQTLGDVALHFIPMRGPFTRGILATAVIPGSWDANLVYDLYRERYADHPFMIVRDTLPDLKPVVNTNMCHIGITASSSALMIVSVIDNLMKGAAGQAVQNMNLMFGCEERAGLLVKPTAF